VKRASTLALAIALLGGCASKHSKAADSANPIVAKGAQQYARLCATCHGKEGNGYIADNAPSLKTTTFLSSASDAFLRAAITRGRPGTAMAGYGRVLGGPLEPADVDAIITFLRVGGPAPVTLPARPAMGDAKAGKVIYDSMCMRCHGTPAQRSSAVHLANPILLQTANDSFLRYAIENGRPPTSMVPWQGTLRPQQIDDVIAYVRTFATPSAVAAVPAPAPAPPPKPLPRKGPIVLNPKGRAPDFKLKEDRYVGIDDVKRAMDEKRRMIITDARPPSDYDSLHIAGAISTPYYEKTSLDDLPNDGTWILAYCACPHHVSGEVVDELRKRGYKHTAVIDEGVFAWQQKKYPVVTAPNFPTPPAPPPQQPAQKPPGAPPPQQPAQKPAAHPLPSPHP
jgi:cytochrome c oxidase cbb3-type subunit 3/ubiquinol-cytochrome c reductase cytochrome c subunit